MPTRADEKPLPPRPGFDELPLKKDGPRGNIWGLFGPEDELGLLNYITAATTQRAAAQEIRTGTRVSVDLPFDFFDKPLSEQRAPFEHNVKQFSDMAAFDDEVKFNTQMGTQWDSYRHFGYFEEKVFYNNTPLDQIKNTPKLGIHNWVSKGGIATRGVLLDLPRWAAAKSVPRKEPFERTIITAQDLRDIIAFQGVTLQEGDILMIRTGFVAAWPSLAEEARTKLRTSPAIIGLEQSEETLRFLWESGAVAVACDALALEAWPVPWKDNRFWLHEWLLAGWGCPIGELFNLEELADECQRLGRWSFFFTSMPLNIKGGVGTPVNGMAIL